MSMACLFAQDLAQLLLRRTNFHLHAGASRRRQTPNQGSRPVVCPSSVPDIPNRQRLCRRLSDRTEGHAPPGSDPGIRQRRRGGIGTAKEKHIRFFRRASYRWYHQAANPSTRANQLRRNKRQWAKRKAVRRWEDPRRGPPRRDGDVSAVDFDAAFRPKCLCFAAAVSQRQRQRIVNRLYDCAMDLAELLEIAPAALFLDRRVACRSTLRYMAGISAGIPTACIHQQEP